MKKVAAWLLVALLLLMGCARVQERPDTIDEEAHTLQILFINAGKADSIAVKYADKAFLIDAGEDSSAPTILCALAYLEVDALDAVFLSHAHSDHIGGLVSIAQKYRVENLYASGICLDKQDKDRIGKLEEALGLFRQELFAGDQIAVQEGVYLDVLGPVTRNAEDDNDNSLVLKLVANERAVLFTGDMQFAEEETLEDKDCKADILKVGNHGNADATSAAFARAVNPEIAVITTDTRMDADSANERVTALFSQVYLTQDYEIGVLVEVDAQGGIHVSNPQRPAVADVALVITEASKQKQSVTMENSGEAVDVSGWFLYSDRGSELFVFPENSVIAENQTITVSAQAGADYVWQVDKIFSNKKTDCAVLYDCYGNIVSVCESS